MGKRKVKKSQTSIAATADVWEDRDGKARPTAERRAKGMFRLVDGDDAGVTVAVDQCATMLDWLALRGMIDGDQAAAGLLLAGLLERTRLVGQGRSCLNFDPVGRDGDEISPQAVEDERDRAEIYIGVGMAAWAELRRVCQDGQGPRDLDKLRYGLDHCVKFWRIA
ncbi:MAG: hypothetical protein RSE12_17040 [Fuscovulum sp.]|nr:MAG: hypothetical protein RSE12_17040 [Fuscovulum sp.]